MAVYFERMSASTKASPISDAGRVNHYYTFIIIKMLIWTFFFFLKEREKKNLKRAKQRAISEGQLLLALAWEKAFLNGITSPLITYQPSDQKFITQAIHFQPGEGCVIEFK